MKKKQSLNSTFINYILNYSEKQKQKSYTRAERSEGKKRHVELWRIVFMDHARTRYFVIIVCWSYQK